MTYLPNGKIDDGPLSTDRPNTGKVLWLLRLKWAKDGDQLWHHPGRFQGTPMGTCLPGSRHFVGLPVGRGPWQLDQFHAYPSTGNFVNSGVTSNARTDNLIQTDLSVHHELAPSKTHEQMRLSFEIQAQNMFNQRAKEAFIEGPVAEQCRRHQSRSRLALLRRPADRLGQGHDRLQLHRRPERRRSLWRRRATGSPGPRLPLRAGADATRAPATCGSRVRFIF